MENKKRIFEFLIAIIVIFLINFLAFKIFYPEHKTMFDKPFFQSKDKEKYIFLLEDIEH